MVTMKHIGLKRVQLTAASSHVIATVLRKTQSISIDTPIDCAAISASISSNSILKEVELYQASGLANNYVILHQGKFQHREVKFVLF